MYLRKCEKDGWYIFRWQIKFAKSNQRFQILPAQFQIVSKFVAFGLAWIQATQ